MNAPAPEAENEYSKGDRGSRGARRRGGPGAGRRRGLPRGAGTAAIAALGVAGAVLLVVAEFSPLYTVHLTSYGARPTSVSTGSHDSYALLPIALLAAALAIGGVRTRAAAAGWALAALGVIALLIALIGDLPDTHAKGISHGLTLVSTSAGAGLYLETLGAVALIAAGGASLLAGLPGGSRRARRPPRSAQAPRTRRVDPGKPGESAS